MPWKVDKNKTALYFDSHQVALILDCQKFTPWPGHCQSVMTQPTGHWGLTQCRQKDKKLVLPAGWRGEYRYFRLTCAQKRFPGVRVHKTANTIKRKSRRSCLLNTKFSSDSAEQECNSMFVDIGASINFSYLVSCL